MKTKGLKVAVLVVVLAGCESDAQLDARYQVARKECAEVGAKAAFALPGSFNRDKEAFAMKAALECLRSRGFKV